MEWDVGGVLQEWMSVFSFPEGCELLLPDRDTVADGGFPKWPGQYYWVHTLFQDLVTESKEQNKLTSKTETHS